MSSTRPEGWPCTGYCSECMEPCAVGVRSDDDDAAIETLRAMLLNHAETCARIKHPYHERRACIAIALALLL